MVSKKINNQEATKKTIKILSAKSGLPATKASLVLAKIKQKREPFLEIPQKYVEKIVEAGNPQQRYSVKPAISKKSRSSMAR